MRTFSLLLFFISLQHLAVQAGDPLIDSTNTYLKEVIINENRLQIPFESQNRNIYIVDRKQIEALPVQSINELLSYVTGVDVRQRGPWGAQADISIDGGTFEQVAFLVNGVKMNDPQSGHNSMNIPIPVNAIERIEVLRGSAARIYGINSLTGAINIVTIKPNSIGAEVQLDGGSNFKENEEHTDKTYHSKGLQLLGTYADETQNHLLSGSINNGSGHRYNTGFKNQKVFYQGHLSINPRNTITVMAGYVYNNFGANGYYAAPSDKESQEITQVGIASVGYTTKLNDRFNLTSQLNYRYSYDDYRFYRNDLSTARNQHYTHILSPEINANYKTDFGDFGFGVEARLEDINSSNIGDHKRNNIGAYAEFRTEEFENFQISAGTYINYNSAFGWRVYPGLDLGYTFAKDWKAYVNTGTGQRVPSFTDLHYDTPGNVGNESLQPENAWYAEGGFKYNNGRLWMNASYFHRQVDDFIDWVRNDIQQPWYAQNFIQNKVNGLTLSADYQVAKNEETGVLAGISYTYLDASLNKKNDQYAFSKYALESLTHQLIGKVIVNHKAFHFTLTERFQERVGNKSYFLTDARLAYRYKKYSVYTHATNLFDAQYIEVATAPMPGRWFSLGIKAGI